MPCAAVVTLLTNDNYLIGVEAWLLSLQKVYHGVIIVLVTPEVSRTSNKVLERNSKARIVTVEKILGPVKERNVEEWRDYTKIHIWNLTEFDRVVYIDADTLVLGDLGELFERSLGKLEMVSWQLLINLSDQMTDHGGRRLRQTFSLLTSLTLECW